MGLCKVRGRKRWLRVVKHSELLLDPSQVPGSELVLLAEGHLQRAAVPVRAVVDLVVRMFDGMFEKLRRGRLQTSPAVQGPDLAPGHDGRGLKLLERIGTVVKIRSGST